MEKSVRLFALFALLVSGCSLSAAGIPDSFVNHTGILDDNTATLDCSYNDSACYYSPTGFEGGGTWSIVINKTLKAIIDQDGFISAAVLDTVVVQSEIQYGVKCLYLSVSTNRHHINWALSVRNPHTETLVGLQGNLKLVKKITVGLASDKPYIIAFYLYGFKDHERPTTGGAYIGKVALVDGPCDEDRPSLNCTFDDNFCNWVIHDAKYFWYRVPFGLHHTIPHLIEWGALAAFGGKGNLWSPVVRTLNVQCFSFIYAKGESTESYLRVWLLYRIPGSKDVRVLLYEDATDHKVIKKNVQVGIFVPFDFQIAFEGRSKTILHGVVVLDTAISRHSCVGTGSYMNVQPDVPEIITDDPNAIITSTEKITTPTTEFGPLGPRDPVVVPQ